MNNQASLQATRFNQASNCSWRLDRQRSRVEFHTRSLWGLATVRGHFDDYTGWLDVGADPAIELTINAASLQTGNRKRDQHLRSADFFDCERHPTVRFVSESVEPEGPKGDTLRVRGRLSARGRSIPLDLTADLRATDGALEIEAAIIASHRDLGMNWNWLKAISPRSKLLVKAHLIRE
jgi:polyisoprenoid-binding protein YceI